VVEPFVGRLNAIYLYHGVLEMSLEIQIQIVVLVIRKYFEERSIRLIFIEPYLLEDLYVKAIKTSTGVRGIKNNIESIFRSLMDNHQIEYEDKQVEIRGDSENIAVMETDRNNLELCGKEVITILESRKKETGTEDYDKRMASLNALIGLNSVKEAIKRILAKARYFDAGDGPGHFLFSGSPGTGKTTVARLLGEILKSCNLLKKGHLIEVTGTELVGVVQGEAQRIMLEKCKEALDGVLFIDEAYALSKNVERGNNVGGEQAIDTIIPFMTNNKKRLCVIFAGYKQDMEKFMDVNKGMERRIAHIIDFPNYSADELEQILVLMAKQDGLILSSEYREAAKIVFKKETTAKKDSFGNAGFVEKLLSYSKGEAALRYGRCEEQGIPLINDDKKTLVQEDLGDYL
jgi:Cdc6-like AAA superfamily ATPase